MDMAIAQPGPEPIPDDDGAVTEVDNGSWLLPRSRPDKLKGLDLKSWEILTDEIRALAVQHGLSKAEVARRANIASATFSQWYNGLYPGNVGEISRKLRLWIEADAERRQVMAGRLEEPGFIETPTARRLLDALTYAQSAPAIVIATLGAGMGKSVAARHFVATRPHAHRIVLQPSTGSSYGVMSELALTLGVPTRDARLLNRAIGERLRRNGRHTVIIIDEGQNLQDKAFNELRHYLDEYGCGIAVLGNDEVFTRWGKVEAREGSAQLHRRIGMRINELRPHPEDIRTYVAAWNIGDAKAVELLHAIGRKPGALGQVAETIRYAATLALAHGRKPIAEDIRRAWANRGGETLR